MEDETEDYQEINLPFKGRGFVGGGRQLSAISVAVFN
jgi:hypothetical protein